MKERGAGARARAGVWSQSVSIVVTNLLVPEEIFGSGGGGSRGVHKGRCKGKFVFPFAHKYPDLHRNKGLARRGNCGIILSTEEQSSRRREQNEAVRRGGNAAQGAHGKPGVPAGGRATGGLRTAAIDAHTSDGLTERSGARAQARRPGRGRQQQGVIR